MLEFIKQPWPWYIAGPLIGMMVPVMFLVSNKRFGVSSSLRHICAACVPGRIAFFQYNWRDEIWSLFFVFGIVIGGFISQHWLIDNDNIKLSAETIRKLHALGITDFNGFFPVEIFNWENLLNPEGIIVIVMGGFLVGFGARWAGGCTSGHTITGISTLQPVSLAATIGFFVGGLIVTYLIYPVIL